MARGGTGNVVPSVVGAEHIGPEATGDNIEAKRVANYFWNGTEWSRVTSSIQPGVDYDYLDVQQTDADTDTYVFKDGGSGGTTVRTIVVNYTDSTKESIDSIAWS